MGLDRGYSSKTARSTAASPYWSNQSLEGSK